MKKSILLNDNYKINEEFVNNNEKNVKKRNELLVYSDDKLLFRGFNKVVNIGRLYNIQTLTQASLNSNSSLYMKDNNLNLYLRCWGAGTGGNVNDDENTPKEVKLDETDLNDPVVFTENNYTNEDNDPNKPAYRDNRKKKDFESVTIYKNSKEEIYAEIKFSVTKQELNGYQITELGFYLWDGTNFYLFSKVNIPVLYKNNTDVLNTSYSFIYRIYA